MAGTQAPKGFGYLFVLVGVPAILWSASGTNEEIKALDSPPSRQDHCLKTIAPLKLSSGDSEAMCGCVVREAEKRGLNKSYGAYDLEGLKPVFELCRKTQVAQ